MKKGLLFLAFVTLGAMAFAQDITTITAVKNGDLYDVTITWKPADDWTAVELRGNYQGDLWGGGKAMTKNADGSWSYTITGMAAGTYEYKFYADDTWMDEADNYPSTVGNPFGGVNGALVVNEDLTKGVITQAWGPKVNLNLNAPLSFRYRDDWNGQAEAFLKFQGYFKLHGEILPNLYTFTEMNLHGLGNQIDLYKEMNTEVANQQAQLRASAFFMRGISIFNNHYVELQKFFLEYRTDFVNVAYSDGYYKWIPESFAGPFFFTIYGVDGTKDNNALMGTWRLMKQDVQIADGIKLDYLLSWGANARRNFARTAIWEGGFNGVDGGSSWDDNKMAYYGFANLAQVKGDFGTIGLNLDATSSSNTNNLDDLFATLSYQIGLGYKADFGIADVSAQLVTQIGETRLASSADNAATNTVIGVKSTIKPMDGITVGVMLAVVGARYSPDRFYATSDEDKAGEYVGSDVSNARITFKLMPKFSLGGITAGLDYKLQVANPLNNADSIATTSDGDIYNDFKVYGGISIDNLWANLYSELKFNIYETIAIGAGNDKVGFEFNTLGLNFGMKDVVPGLLNTINLYYELALAGQGTSVATDNAMGNSVLVTADLATDTSVHLGVGFVGGDANSTVPNDQSTLGYALGVQQAFPFMDSVNMTKYHVFLQYKHGLSIFDSDDQGKIKLDDYRIDNMGTGLREIYDEIILGVWFDY